METVKLQILLTPRLGDDQLRVVEERLADLGVTITGRGAVTLSASMPADRFQATFGRAFKGRSGFALTGSFGETLAVPASLRDYVETISETPRHEPMKK
jgi:hypothetical protein